MILCGCGAGVRVPAVISECGGNVDGEDAERDGHVYGEQCVLCAIGYSDIVGVCGVCIPRVYVAVIRVPPRLFHNQRFTFSSLMSLSGVA